MELGGNVKYCKLNIRIINQGGWKLKMPEMKKLILDLVSVFNCLSRIIEE